MKKNKGNKANLGRHYYTNGIINVMSKKMPIGFWKGMSNRKPKSEETKLKLSKIFTGRKLMLETKIKISANAKLCKWYNNGVKESFSKECPEGFVEGRLKIGHTWNKGLPNSIETRKKISDANKGRKWFNDGVKSIMAFECPKGFVKGRLKTNSKSTKGRKWFNNGIKNVLAFECPEGYVNGQLCEYSPNKNIREKVSEKL